MAFGIGANDVANTFGTSVGAKSLKLWQACIIAGVMEFAGCLLLGKNVTDTVRKGIVDPAAFADAPQVLMLGMFCALAGAGIWLMLATSIAMPVSTTHSIIGSILGFGLVYGKANETINWEKVGLVCLSWVAAPCFACIFAAAAYWFTRWAVLRREDSYKASKIFYPIFLFIMFTIMALFVTVKAAGRYQLPGFCQGKDEAGDSYWILHDGSIEGTTDGQQGMWSKSDCKDAGGKYIQDLGLAIGVSLAIALVMSAITYFLVFRLLVEPRIAAADTKDVEARWAVKMDSESQAELDRKNQANNMEKGTELREDAGTPPVTETPVTGMDGVRKLDEKKEEPKEFSNICAKLWHLYLNPELQDEKVHDTVSGAEAKIHVEAEQFDAKTELVFSGVQIATAAFDSFAHGANDTANAIGPLAAFALVIGLGVFGWRVIRAIGVKLVHVTPSRGFTMELSSALAVIIASKLSIPVSTTHCQVGAEIGVGLLEGGCSAGKYCKGVNWGLMAWIFLAWVLTLVFAGGVTALLFSLCLYSPFYPEHVSGLEVTMVEIGE